MSNYHQNPEAEEERRREVIRRRKRKETLRCIARSDTEGLRNVLQITNLTDGWRLISQPPYLLHRVAGMYYKPDYPMQEESMRLIRMIYGEFINPPRSMWYLEDEHERTIWKVALDSWNDQFIDFLAQRAVSQDITVSNDRRGESEKPDLASMLDKLSMLSITETDVKNSSSSHLGYILKSTILHKRMSQVIGMEESKKKNWNEKILKVLRVFFARIGRSTTFIADFSGNTFLHLAILGKNDGAIQFLLQKGVHHDQENRTGMTPLNLAVETNNELLFKRLCYIGASIHWFFEPEEELTRPKIQAISARPSFAEIATNVYNLQKQHASHHLQKFEEALPGVKVVSNLHSYMKTEAHNRLNGRTFHIDREELRVAGKEYALALLPMRYSTSRNEFGICDCLVRLESPPQFLYQRLVNMAIDSELESNFYVLKPRESSYIQTKIRNDEKKASAENNSAEKNYNSVLAVIISFDAPTVRISNRNGAGPSSSHPASLQKLQQSDSSAKKRRLEK